MSLCSRAYKSQLLKPKCPKACAPATIEATSIRSPHTTKSSPHSPQLEKAFVQQRRPDAAKKTNCNYFLIHLHSPWPCAVSQLHRMIMAAIHRPSVGQGQGFKTKQINKQAVPQASTQLPKHSSKSKTRFDWPDTSFPNDSVGIESACTAEDRVDTNLIPGSGKFPGEGNGNPLQYACLGNPSPWGCKVRHNQVTKHTHV